MEAKHYFPGYPKLKTEKGVWREDYWCGGKEVGVAAPPHINLIVLLLYPKADLYSLDGRLPINLIVGLVFLVGKTSNLQPGNLRSVTFQLIESWKLEAGC
jgi:hypothetical protein